MKWHKYADEKPEPLEICLIKHYYDRQNFGESEPRYMLCEYSNLGDAASEPWTELNGEAESYGRDYSEYWISISEIEGKPFKENHTCSKCGRYANNICYYQKNDKLYCSVCVYDFLKSQKDAENMTVDAALREYGYRVKWYGIHND